MVISKRSSSISMCSQHESENALFTYSINMGYGLQYMIRHLFLAFIKDQTQVINGPYPLDLIEGVLHKR